MNKADLIQKIKQLEGISQDERSYLINLVNTKKKYGLVWEDKQEEVEEQLRTQLPVLREVVEKRITAPPQPSPEGREQKAPLRAASEIKDMQTSLFKPENIEQSDSSSSPLGGGREGAPNHILIEGDNLHVLTALTFTHEGKIDVIYIDPPYNTGNKDFKYNDRFVDKEDSYRHSKWLSFMDKRLRIAKRLLSDKGVLFISIDDYSYSQLKMLCDEIFEWSNNPDRWNNLATLIWNKQHSQQQGVFKRYHEYIAVYAKNKDSISNIGGGIGIIEAGALKKVSIKNPESTYDFPAGVKFEAKDGTCLSGTFGDSEKVRVINGHFVAESGKTKYPITLAAGWTQKNQMKSWFAGKETIDTKGQKVIEFYFNSTGKLKCRKQRGSITPPSILPEYGMVSEQTERLNDIFNAKEVFSNPKPVQMITDFISWFGGNNSTILDFFAGSGTTLHATMQLNAEDGGNRQCILVTNNENNICEEVTYERNRRVIQGYANSKGEWVKGLINNNLRYYKSEFVGREPSLKNKRELTRMATELLCIKEDCYEEKILDFAFTNQSDRKNIRFFEEKNTRMLIVYDDSAIEAAVEIIKSIIATNHVKENGIKVYVFSPGQYPFTEEFEEVLPYISLCALPDAIYKALMNVLPKKNRPIVPVLEDDNENQPELFD